MPDEEFQDAIEGDDFGPKKPKEVSYTYWKRRIDNANLIISTPERLEQPPPAAKVAVAASAWNGKGTWEEKDVSQNFSRDFGSMAIDSLLLQGIDVQELDAKDGKASIVIVRGQPRLGYEISFTAKLKNGGVLEVSEFCDYDPNFELKLSGAKKASESTLRTALLQFRSGLVDTFMEKEAERQLAKQQQ